MKIKKVKKNSKILVKAKLIAQQVLDNFDEYHALSIADLKIRTDYLIDGLAKNKFTLEDIVVDAFSIAREMIYREHGMLPFEVQIMGAYVVHCGDFAEMYTGEGKTITILLVSFLNALLKRGVHVVTVNEYLVQRDAEFSQKAFAKLGLEIGYNTSKLSKKVKKQMFAKDITYTTNSELGFDYLKDNMVRNIEEKVIRDLYFVIIDEADSVLIDEARIPLIISGQPKEDFSLYLDVDKFVGGLKEEDYTIDTESNTIALSDQGVIKAEKFFKVENLYSLETAEIVHKITNALVAYYIFANGKEYLVKSDKIYLVDQFTGRILEGRSYNAGLHQAIQAKEKVKIEPENVIMATITYQSFFRLYEKLSGVSGTAMTEAEEFLKIYNMVVVRVPTNRPVIRVDKQDYIFGTKRIKWDHVVAEIVKRHKLGQPVLVGTASVTDSEIIHERLKKLNIAHEVLNARDNSKEAEIVKHAGEKFAITISTNMAGRGTDIKVDDEVKKLGGLYVIGTERHESRRIDNQLRGRTGRQGDPGESRFFTSLEDSLFKRFATDKFEKASTKLEDEYYDSRFFSNMLNRTQKKVEGLNFDIRKNLMDYDHVLSLQRELIYKQRDQILLKTNNFDIINNMINDFVSFQINNFKNKDNTSLIDSKKVTEFLNTKILKFTYFDSDFFANKPLINAAEQVIDIIKKIIATKYEILTQINALNVVEEILIVNLDQKWTRHIDKMTKLREGVNLRSLEQRSPLNIYIEDGNELFEKMKNDVVNDTITNLCNLSLPNEMNEITNSLNSYLNSDEFKKKEYEDSVNNQNYSYSTNISEFENYIKEKKHLPEDEIEEPKEEEPEEKFMNPLGLFISKYKKKKADKYKLEYGSSEANILDEKTELIDKSFSELKTANENVKVINQNEISKNESEVEFPLNTKQITKEVEAKLVIDEKTSDNSTSDIKDYPTIQLENSKKKQNKVVKLPVFYQKPFVNNFDSKKTESEPDWTYNAQMDLPLKVKDEKNNLKKELPENKLEELLLKPTIKDENDNITVGNHLDNDIKQLDIDNDQENLPLNEIDEDENLNLEIKQTSNFVNKNDLNLNVDVEKKQPIETLKDYDITKSDDLKKEVDCFVTENIKLLEPDEKEKILNEIKKSIIYNLSKDKYFKKYLNTSFSNKTNKINYLKIMNDNKTKDNIKTFYKIPVVEKKEPHTLFGGTIMKKTPFTFHSENTYEKEKKKMDELFRENNQATEEEMNNLLYLNDEEARLAKIESKKISEEEIKAKELSDLIDNESFIFDKPENNTKQDVLEPIDTIDNKNENLENWKDENADVVKMFLKQENKALSEVELEEKSDDEKVIEESNESTEIDKNNIEEKLESNPSQSIDQPSETTQSNSEKKEVHNLQKDIIDYLRIINNKEIK